MAKPINLNRVRKERARKAARDTADRNAVLHGLPKAAKAQAKAEAALLHKRHAGGKKHNDTDAQTPKADPAPTDRTPPENAPPVDTGTKDAGTKDASPENTGPETTGNPDDS